jgi:hypothetical protein
MKSASPMSVEMMARKRERNFIWAVRKIYCGLFGGLYAIFHMKYGV